MSLHLREDHNYNRSKIKRKKDRVIYGFSAFVLCITYIAVYFRFDQRFIGIFDFFQNIIIYFVRKFLLLKIFFKKNRKVFKKQLRLKRITCMTFSIASCAVAATMGPFLRIPLVRRRFLAELSFSNSSSLSRRLKNDVAK